MKLKLTHAILGFAVLLMAASCAETKYDWDSMPDPNEVLFPSIVTADQCFVLSKSSSDVQWNTLAGANVNVVFNTFDHICQIQIANLEYAPGKTTTLALYQLPMEKQTDATVRVCSTVGQPVIQVAGIIGGAYQQFNISDLSIRVISDPNRTFKNSNGKAVPVGDQVFVSFKIDDYSIRIVQKKNYFFGTTTSVCDSREYAPFSTSVSKYLMELNPSSGTANITIENARFLEAMPAGITMIFPGIGYEATTGGFSLQSAALVPMAGNRPFQQYEVTNLSATMAWGRNATLSFTCPHVPLPDMTSGTTYSFDISASLGYQLSSEGQ